MEKEDDITTPFCLSFNSYTNDRIAETAKRVRLEFSDEFEFPILDQNLIVKDESSLPLATATTQLREFFLQEDESYSSSSSDEEEFDVIFSLKGGWRKRASSSTSWRISDLLKRSYSEGKQSLKFLNSHSRNRDEFKKEEKEKVCAHEKFYLRNKSIKNNDKRKSYLPYKQHLVNNDHYPFI